MGIFSNIMDFFNNKDKLIKLTNEAWIKNQTFDWYGSTVKIWFMYGDEKYHSLCGWYQDSEDGKYYLIDIYHIARVYPEYKVIFDNTEKLW